MVGNRSSRPTDGGQTQVLPLMLSGSAGLRGAHGGAPLRGLTGPQQGDSWRILGASPPPCRLGEEGGRRADHHALAQSVKASTAPAGLISRE